MIYGEKDTTDRKRHKYNNHRILARTKLENGRWKNKTYHVAEGRKSCSINGEAEGAACHPAGTVSSHSLIKGSDYDPICILDVRPQI